MPVGCAAPHSTRLVYIQCGFFSFLYKSHHYLVKSIMCSYMVPFGVGVSPHVNLESLSSHYT
jgi:hypothetical protein